MTDQPTQSAIPTGKIPQDEPHSHAPAYDPSVYLFPLPFDTEVRPIFEAGAPYIIASRTQGEDSQEHILLASPTAVGYVTVRYIIRTTYTWVDWADKDETGWPYVLKTPHKAHWHYLLAHPEELGPL